MSAYLYRIDEFYCISLVCLDFRSLLLFISCKFTNFFVLQTLINN